MKYKNLLALNINEMKIDFSRVLFFRSAKASLT